MPLPSRASPCSPACCAAREPSRSTSRSCAPIRAGTQACPYEMVPTHPRPLPRSARRVRTGGIPEGWDIRPIGEVIQVLGGGTPSTKQRRYWKGGEHSFCTPKGMSGLSSSVLSETERHLTGGGVARVNSGVLPTGTVLLSSRATIDYPAIAEVSVSVNQGIIAIVCNRMLPNLLCYCGREQTWT